MTLLVAKIEGIGFWADGLPSWEAARAFAAGGALPGDAPARPAPELLPANERRRAPGTVAVALDAALAACRAAGADPAALPSVFASTHGDLGITDYICATLAGDDPASLSPTRFHNSVHNAAAGYWTIGAGSHAAATALSAGGGTFAQALVEAMSQLQAGEPRVLLVAYDGPSAGPLAAVARSEGLLGAALVLSRAPDPTLPRLRGTFVAAPAPTPPGPLGRRLGANAMAPMLPLFDALASGRDLIQLDAGPGRALRVEIAHA